MRWILGITLAILLFATAARAQYVPIPDEPSGPGCPGDSTQCSGYKVRTDINNRFSGAVPISPTFVSPQGNGSKVQLSTGTTTPNDCVKFDANGNTVDNGGNCGGAGFPLTGPASTNGQQINGGATNGSDQINNISINGVYNVKAYGALCSPADDTVAIQSAINAACAATTGSPPVTPTVYFPTCIYRHTKPFIDSCQQPLNFVGAGEQSTQVTWLGANDTLMPHFVVEPYNYVAGLGTLTGVNLATGCSGCASINFTQGQIRWYELKDAQNGGGSGTNTGQPLNGLGAFTVEAFVDLTASANTTYSIVTSTGVDNNNGTFGALNFWTSAISGSTATQQFCLTLSVSGRVCASNTMSTNAMHFLEGSYDGTTLRLFVDGTDGTTHAGTGTIVEPTTEALLLGAQEIGVWEGSAQYGWVGQLQSIRLSNVARHTSNYTAPTALLGSDSNTIVLINGTAFDDALLFVDYYYGGGTAWIYGFDELTNAPAAERFHISDMSIVNGSYGILANWALNASASNLYIQGMSEAGILKWYNSYGWDEDNVYSRAANYAQCAYEGSNSGIVNSKHLKANGGLFGLCLNSSSGVYSDTYLLTSASAQTGISANGIAGLDLYDFINPLFDTESGGTVLPMRLGGGGTYRVELGNFQTVSGSGKSAIEFDPNGMQATLDGSILDVDSSATALTIGTATNSPPFLSPVILNNVDIDSYSSAQWLLKSGVTGAIMANYNNMNGSGASFDFGGTPAASQVIATQCPYSLVFPPNFPNATATCGTDPSETDTYTVEVAGSSIGTVALSTGCVATFATSSGAAEGCTVGQRLEVDAPSTVSGADIAITLGYVK